MAGGSYPAPKRPLLKARSGVGAMAKSNMQKALSLPLYHLKQIRPLEGHRTQRLRNPMSMDTRDEADLKRCVTTPRRTRARLMTVGKWQTDFSMAMGMQ